MEYKNRVKNRKIKRYLTNFLKIFKFRGINLTFSQKIILFGVFFNFVSLFFSWVDSIDNKISESSFSDLSGNIGFFIIFILGFIIFNIFSINNKEKMQLHIGIHFKDYPVSIVLGVFLIFISIMSINFINAFQTFSSNIIYGNGVILSITSGVIILIGGIIQRIEFHKFSSGSNIYENINNNDLSNENEYNADNNMKLPF